MKAVCWMGKEKMSVENVPDPRILNPRDAIVRITSTAICGSDLHLYGGFIPTMEQGDIMGHEFMGEVVEVGPGVDRNKLKVGDRVVVPFTIACGNCFFCKRQLWSCCDNSNPKLLGCGRDDGLLALWSLRLYPHARRLRRRTGAVRACALCRCRPAENPVRYSRRQGALPVRHLPHRLFRRGECGHQVRRHRRCLGMWSGWAIRDSQRFHAGRGAGNRHRPL